MNGAGWPVNQAMLIVTAGGADAVQLLVEVLAVAGNKVVLEDPWLRTFPHHVEGGRCRVLPQPVDRPGP
jgi:DNA-binding transcriptional MocR family regulator